MTIEQRLEFPILCVATDRTLLNQGWTLAQAVAPCVTGGANLVIMRENDLPKGPRTSVANFVLEGIRGRCPLIIEGDLAFATAVKAQGVLSGSNENLETKLIVGTFVSSTNDTHHSINTDFWLINLDWSNPINALEVVRSFSKATDVPIIAGMDVPIGEVHAAIMAGAQGVCVTGLAMNADDKAKTMKLYWQELIKGETEVEKH